MLRGSSRHDGIPNKQSARERDRDRLRERQRQERQQMLPNDEKDINVGAQDLFHAPVKVKPSVDDSTSAQIANTLGSFDTVRHLILDTSSRRLTNLIGVDQGSLPGTPVATRQPPSSQQLISGGGGGHSSADNNQHSSTNNKQPSYFQPSSQQVGQQQQQQLNSELNSGGNPAKNHHRNLFNNTGTGLQNSHSNSSATEFNFPPSSAVGGGGGGLGNFRSSSSSSANSGGTQGVAKGGVAHNNNQSSLPTHISNSSSNNHNNTSSSTSSSGNNIGQGTAAAVGGLTNHSSSSSGTNNSSSHNSTGYVPTTGSNNSSSGSASANSSAIISNNQQLRQQQTQQASSFNNNSSSNSNNNCNSVPPSTVTDVVSLGGAEGFPSANKTVTASSNALLGNKEKESFNTSASGAVDDNKNSRHASSNRKPALERADSQLEIESMLKEMMDVTAPLTAIQTPVKETSTKKFTQRRSSKSEEKIVQSIRDSGMADAVPSPVQRMDSSGDSSSSYDTETSDSESEDSSSGSQAGGEKNDTVIPKITPNTNSPTRWNLGAFMGPRKNDYRADTNNTSTLGGAKSPKDTKPNAHQVNAINSETSPGDVPIKTESVVSSTSLFNKSNSLSPLEPPPNAPPLTRKSTRNIVEVKSEPPPKPPPPTNTTKSSSNSKNKPVTNKSQLSGSSSEEDKKEKANAKVKKETSSSRANTLISEREKQQQDKSNLSAGSGSGAGAGGAGSKRKRKRSSSSSTEQNSQHAQQTKGGNESSPENAAIAAAAAAASAASAAAATASAASASGGSKNKKNIQDRNKNDTIRRLFLFKQQNKSDSPTRGDNSSDLGKSPSSAKSPKANSKESSSGSTSASASSGTGGGKGAKGGKGGKSSGTHGDEGKSSRASGKSSSSSSNRVQAKDSKGKRDSSSKGDSANNVHNGEFNDPSANSIGATVIAEPTVSKKKGGGGGDDGGGGGGAGGSKTKESSSSSSSSSARTSHGKKNQKSANTKSKSPQVKEGKSSSSTSSSKDASLLPPPPPPPAAKVKEDRDSSSSSSKNDKGMSSSLVVKIALSKLKRWPSMMPAPPPPPPLLPPPAPVLKVDKEKERDSGSGSSSSIIAAETKVKTIKEREIKEPHGTTPTNADPFHKRVHHNSSRVGSSSDHAKDGKATPQVATHNNPPPILLAPPDVSLCSDKDFKGRKRSKSKKVKSSPKKTKTKHEPDSHSKVEEDTACGEVSSNVLGYASCDSVSVSTTRTPPVEADVVQAPDSSLNPPHLPSPVVPPQPVYFSYFEKNDHLEDYYSRDQDSYLEEAKRLKHKADGERVSTTQASVYLEAGLYFILTGISMERDRTVGSTAAFTMYKDTLVLIRYIGSRFRSRNNDYSNPTEAKIIVLSMRCQSLLSYKLFKIKMRETKEMVQYLQDHFTRHPTLDLPPVVSSPQLSTPSPHSPTSSPAASSSLHPSPHHHPSQIMTTIPRNLYSNMQKTCGSAMHLISAHELWDAADGLVEKYRVEEFFIQMDRQFGPLTLHNTLIDLVRYVKHALQIIKTTELS